MGRKKKVVEFWEIVKCVSCDCYTPILSTQTQDKMELFICLTCFDVLDIKSAEVLQCNDTELGLIGWSPDRIKQVMQDFIRKMVIEPTEIIL